MRHARAARDPLTGNGTSHNPTDDQQQIEAASKGRPPIVVHAYVDGETAIYLDIGDDPNAKPIALTVHAAGDDPMHEFAVEARPISELPGRIFGAVLEHDRRAAAYASDVACGTCENDDAENAAC